MSHRDPYYAITPPEGGLEHELIQKGYKLLDPLRSDEHVYAIVHVTAKQFWFTTEKGVEFIQRLTKLVHGRELQIINIQTEEHGRTDTSLEAVL